MRAHLHPDVQSHHVEVSELSSQFFGNLQIHFDDARAISDERTARRDVNLDSSRAHGWARTDFPALSPGGDKLFRCKESMGLVCCPKRLPIDCALNGVDYPEVSFWGAVLT